MKQYETQGLEGLSRADAQTGDVLPEGIDRTEENYKREIRKVLTFICDSISHIKVFSNSFYCC